MVTDLIVYTPMYVTFFWAILLLLTKREDNRAKFFLGGFMAIAFLLYLSHSIFFEKIVTVYSFIDPLYIFSSLSVYPLYYWYIKLLTIETGYRWYNLKLLIPAVVFSLTSLVLYQMMNENDRIDYILGFLVKSKSDISYTATMQLQKLVYFGSRLVFTIQIIYFVVLGLRLVKNYNKQIANYYSNLESRSILWVNYILYSLVVTSAASIIFNLIGRSYFVDSNILLLIPSIIFSVLLFFIGLQGYMQNHTVTDMEFDDLNEKNFGPQNYNNLRLNEKLLNLFINEEIYKQPDLKITYVTEKLNTNRTYVSKHINTEFSCTFNEYVNRYRIEEAKRLLSDEKMKNYSLNYISEKSGFGSMGSFMRVFRDMEGITPGEYRKRNTNY